MFDNKPLAITYYRKHSIDFDGKEEFSDVVYARKKDMASNQIIDMLVPNPAYDNMNILYTADSDSEINIMVTDLTGKVFVDGKHTVLAGSNSLPLNLAAWPNGLYVIRVC